MTTTYDQAFRAQLDGFDFETLERDASCIYGIARDLTINYVNPAWHRFAQENGGRPDYDPLGRHVTDAMHEPHKSYFNAVYTGLFESGQVWQHEYDCSSDSVCRMFHQTVYPLRNRSSLLVVHSLRLAMEEARQPGRDIWASYVEHTGMVTSCVHCKRVRDVRENEKWDYLPQRRQAAGQISHSLCQICYDYFYKHLPRPKAAASQADRAANQQAAPE